MAGRNLYPADIEIAVKHEAIRPGCVAAVAAPRGRPRDRGRAEGVEGHERRARSRVPPDPNDGRSPDRLRAGDGRVRATRVVAEDAERKAPPARDPQRRSRPATGCWRGSISDDHGFHRRPDPGPAARRARGRDRRAGRRVPRRRVAQRRRRRLSRPDRRALARPRPDPRRPRPLGRRRRRPADVAVDGDGR